ncbi:MAG: hypothetical protein ABIQ18_44825 [Umezawaea sp.]
MHHAYIARATFPKPVPAVYQLTCSPIHNTVLWFMRLVFRAGWGTWLSSVARWWSRRAGVPATPIDWTNISGPHFGNAITTIHLAGGTAVPTIEQAIDHGLGSLPHAILTSPR